jgi:hypothetical protein
MAVKRWRPSVGVEQGHHVRFLGDDGAHRERLPAVLGQLAYRCFRGYFVAGVAQHHGVAIRGQPVGDLLPDAARSAGDDGGVAAARGWRVPLPRATMARWSGWRLN